MKISGRDGEAERFAGDLKSHSGRIAIGFYSSWLAVTFCGFVIAGDLQRRNPSSVEVGRSPTWAAPLELPNREGSSKIVPRIGVVAS
jgi:hypothetical protein